MKVVIGNARAAAGSGLGRGLEPGLVLVAAVVVVAAVAVVVAAAAVAAVAAVAVAGAAGAAAIAAAVVATYNAGTSPCSIASHWLPRC